MQKILGFCDREIIAKAAERKFAVKMAESKVYITFIRESIRCAYEVYLNGSRANDTDLIWIDEELECGNVRVLAVCRKRINGASVLKLEYKPILGRAVL